MAYWSTWFNQSWDSINYKYDSHLFDYSFFADHLMSIQNKQVIKFKFPIINKMSSPQQLCGCHS